jgi:hypothetical protein
MVNKKKSVDKKSETFGIVGFTLSLAGFFAILITSIYSAVYFITGLIFCIIQQKRNKTKLGKVGLILNIIGIVAVIILTFVIILYVYPLMSKQGLY